MTLLSKSTETATPELRWLDVGGMRPVLQQKWILRVEAKSLDHLYGEEEVWRDVPTVQKKR